MSHVGPTPPNAAPPEPVPEARPATLLPEGVDRRLHPATVLVDIVRRIAGLAYLIAIALFLRFAGGGGGIAFRAHIGGFIAGMLLIPLFRRKDVPLRSPWGGR